MHLLGRLGPPLHQSCPPPPRLSPHRTTVPARFSTAPKLSRSAPPKPPPPGPLATGQLLAAPERLGDGRHGLAQPLAQLAQRRKRATALPLLLRLLHQLVAQHPRVLAVHVVCCSTAQQHSTAYSTQMGRTRRKCPARVRVCYTPEARERWRDSLQRLQRCAAATPADSPPLTGLF